MDGTQLSRIKNGKNMNNDFFKVYCSIEDDVLKKIMAISLDKSYGSKIDMITRQVLYLKSLDDDVQILVFSQWPDFLKLLARAFKQNNIKFISSMNIATDVTTRISNKKLRSLKGSAEIELFKKDPSITCFLLNAKAQAAGLTLTNASHVFLCEPLVNLPLELQAISRIHRIGQTHETTVWNFVIEGSVEESIAYMSTKKRLKLMKESQPKKSSKSGTPKSEQDGSIHVNDDVLDATELSKTLDGMVDSNDSEVISNGDLWGSFFAASATEIIQSVVD
ncbi:unnamed protein product [Ambrosiozyma monospora]|uniref:Unnamed protein product n=1 Tax=Ambrosiozyma monospora TaxID=43982 RepID=A0ACB5TRQ7_AMBMO|nr:unnamed protein product [Ambrosiozyma monospora]